MKKEYWLMIGSIIFSLITGLGLIRWLAPELFGMPTDAKIVKLSKELPAFFDTIFRSQAEKDSNDFLINDPITLVRARPLAEDNVMFGPHDVLGFRNYFVPNVAPIVTIGDSQTYGNNVSIDFNWPNLMLSKLNLPTTAVYSMATGGWGAVQYLNMFAISGRFKPRVIIIAYYTGNDSLESFKAAYSIDKWSFLRPDKKLSLADMPQVAFPAPETEWWTVKFNDGYSMVFTPRLRYYSNDPVSPSAEAGYLIMKEAAHIMDETVKGGNARLIFTIIPTKEMVYSKRIKMDGINYSKDYSNLISAEMNHIVDMKNYFSKLQNSRYIDVIEPLQQAAMVDSTLYPEDKDGHPLQGGYSIIGETLAKALSDLSKPASGIVAVIGGNKTYQLYLINQEGVWKVPSESMLEKNGWNQDFAPPQVTASELALYPQQGMLLEVNPKRFGPSILEHH